MTNLDSILKSTDIALPTKIRLVKAMFFPVVMYGCESWTVKKSECQRIDAFELWCWRRLLRVPWTARRSNQSILKVISHGCSLEGLMLRLKLQYFGHIMWRVDSLEKILMLGGIGGRRRNGRQRMRWLDSIADSMDMSLSKSCWWTGKPGVLRFMGLQRVGHDWVTELNWTEYFIVYVYHIFFIHSFVKTLWCFHVVAIVIVLQWWLCTCIFFNFGFLRVHVLLDGSDGKESACNVGDPVLIPGSGRSPEEGNGNLLQCSCLEKSMEKGDWQAIVHAVTKSWARLSK